MYKETDLISLSFGREFIFMNTVRSFDWGLGNTGGGIYPIDCREMKLYYKIVIVVIAFFVNLVSTHLL